MIIRVLNENERSLLKLAAMELALETHESRADDTPKLSSAPGKRAENREVQVQRVLEAAKKCFVRSGFRGASMHDICREAEMSPGALYRYFPSKEAIIEAIAEKNRREDMAFLSRIGNGPTLIDGFIIPLMAHIRHVHATGMGPLFTEIRAESMRNETVRDCCYQSEIQVMNTLGAFIENAAAEGLINPIAEIGTLLPVMMAIGEGLIFSNLPEQGVDADKLEPFLRVITAGLLRPVEPTQINSSQEKVK
jgi:TetR/AcrR family transcriptional regulator, repressor for uid operon